MNPFTVLNVPFDCDDATVRRAWQAAVQANPPEKDPERFQAVQEAWQRLQTERDRWDVRLSLPAGHGPTDGPLRALVNYLRLSGRGSRLDAPGLRSWIAYCAQTGESRKATAGGIELARIRQKARKGGRRRR